MGGDTASPPPVFRVALLLHGLLLLATGVKNLFHPSAFIGNFSLGQVQYLAGCRENSWKSLDSLFQPSLVEASSGDSQCWMVRRRLLKTSFGGSKPLLFNVSAVEP